MILSVHATFGAAVASLVPSHPVAGFGLGFLSHLILDAIPHRDYDLISITSDTQGKTSSLDFIRKKFQTIRDIIFVLADALVGILLAFVFFFNPEYPFVFLIGAVASMIPDFLTFLYFIFKFKPLVYFFKFHSNYVHPKYTPKVGQFVGVILQFFTISIIIGIIFLIKNLLA